MRPLQIIAAALVAALIVLSVLDAVFGWTEDPLSLCGTACASEQRR